MELKDFDTLELARVYEEPKERMVSPDMVVSILTRTDSILTLKSKALTDSKAAGFLLALTGSVTEFNLMNSHPVGQEQQLLLAHLVAIGAVSATCSAMLIGYANINIKPFEFSTQEDFDECKDLGEILILNPNSSQHTIRITINNKPRAPQTLIVQHRYGPDSTNITGWIDRGYFQGVEWTQRTYECQVEKSPAIYQELRVVSDLTLGVTEIGV